jgi:hypothetical protein
MNRSPLRRLAAILVSIVGLVACSVPGGGSPLPAGPDDAARIVLATDERFAGIQPRNPDLIGQAAWYEVTESADGWRVKVNMGWGDCPAGCINHHAWTYEVSRAGEVRLLSEEGDPLADETGVRGVVVAGPTCPVVTDPPDPDCEDRAVAGAVLVILDADGGEVARATSSGDGTFALALAPGAYSIVPEPVEGLMGTASEVDVWVEMGEPPGELVIAYDTGIR